MKIGRLRLGPQRTNEDNRFTLAGWEYETGYWRWCLDWRFPLKGWSLERWGWPRLYWRSGRYWHGSLYLPVLGAIGLSGQPAFEAMRYRKECVK